MKPTPVLFAHYGQDWIRGSEQCLLDLVAGVDRQRILPVVVCNQHIVADAARALGAIATVTQEAAPAKIFASGNQIRVLAGVAREHGIRLIHANTSDMFPALLRVARAASIPVLAHMHIIPNEIERRHLLLHQASMIVGVSHASVAGFAEEGMSPEKICVVYNAVDGARISNGDASGLRASLGIPDGAWVAATVGSLIERKGHDVAINAIGECRAKGADVYLLVCGSGEDEGALRALAESLGVSPYVHFLGYQKNIGAILRDAVNVCIAPSRWEAFPLNVLEAQWHGVPVIASDIPAHQEALINRASSVIVPLNDASALATAITEFMGDPTRTENARTITMPEAQQRFSMTRYVSEFETIYSELCAVPRYRFGWVLGSSWPRAYNKWARDIAFKRLSREKSP